MWFYSSEKEEDISFWLKKLEENPVNIKINKNKNKNKKLEEERLKLLKESSIDFSKFGWVEKVAKLFSGISPCKARKYIEKHFPDIAVKCYKGAHLSEY